MSLVRSVVAPLLLLCLSLNAQAELIVNPSKGYAFDVPRPWRLASPDFMLEGPDGASLMEADIPSQKTLTLEQISKTAGMIACIGADYATTNERFTLDGGHWTGLVTVFVEPRRTGRPPRHVLQLVARHGDKYRLFYFAMPTRDWLGNRDVQTQLLKALRFI